MTRVAVYSRVSTEEQITESQLVEVMEYCRQKGYTVVKVFEEEISGAVDPLERPVFREMLEFVRRENIVAIVIYDMTRFYRAPSPTLALARLNDIMEKYGVIIEFVAEPQIQDPLLNELWRFMKAFISTYERMMISMRTRYGLRRVREEGRLYHRPTLLHYFAYVYLGKPKPKDDERDGLFLDLTIDKFQHAARAFILIVERYRQKVPWSSLPAVLIQHEPLIQTMYEYFPNAPRSPEAYKRAYELAKQVTKT